MLIKKIKNFVSLLKRIPSQNQNIKVYESEDTVEYYLNQEFHLQPGEQKIIEILGSNLSRFSMLDIGVGTGRTSKFFSPVVNKYVGVDYSSRMVDVCRKKFPHLTFDTQDVRSLQYPDNSFDFVLFSFNGLDSISPQDRVKAMDEIYRIIKPGGYFAFSSHNLKGVDKLFSFTFTLNLKKWYKTIVLRSINKNFKTFNTENYVTIVDGAHGYEVTNYYTTPEYQCKQLAQQGYGELIVIDMQGNTITPQEAYNNRDLWIYYLGLKVLRS